MLRLGEWQIVSGVGYVEEQDAYAEQIDVSITTANLYAYGQWQSRAIDLGLYMGFSVDSFELKNSVFEEPIDKDRLNPRLGLVWAPRVGTAVRAALASTLKRPLVRSQTIEPTQVAGFNQYYTGFELFFGDPDGTVSERVSIAVDQALSSSLKAGLEISKRVPDGRAVAGRLQMG